MDANVLLTQFTIPTPCPMDWNHMTGDERTRFCERCGKHVYNLSAMSPDERSSLTSRVLSDGEELCGRLYQRPDGTLVATECPAELEGGTDARPSTIRGLLAGIAARAAGSSRDPAMAGEGTGAWQFTIRALMVVIAACATALGITRSWLLSPEVPAPAPPMSRRFPVMMGKMMLRRDATPTTGAPSCPSAAAPGPGLSG